MLKSLLPWKHTKTKVMVVDTMGDEAGEQRLAPCQICGRTFLPLPLRKHAPICEKNSIKRRKVFDSMKQRIEGTDLAQFHQKSYLKKQEVKTVEIKVKKAGSWEEDHRTLVDAIRSAKGNSRAMSPPKKPVVSSSNERCPFCDRQFGPKAFDRHVEWCREHQARAQKSPANVLQAKERLEARTKYRVPIMNKPKKLSVKEKYSSLSPIKKVESVTSIKSTPFINRNKANTKQPKLDLEKKNVSDSKILETNKPKKKTLPRIKINASHTENLESITVAPVKLISRKLITWKEMGEKPEPGIVVYENSRHFIEKLKDIIHDKDNSLSLVSFEDKCLENKDSLCCSQVSSNLTEDLITNQSEDSLSADSPPDLILNDNPNIWQFGTDIFRFEKVPNLATPPQNDDIPKKKRKLNSTFIVESPTLGPVFENNINKTPLLEARFKKKRKNLVVKKDTNDVFLTYQRKYDDAFIAAERQFLELLDYTDFSLNKTGQDRPQTSVTQPKIAPQKLVQSAGSANKRASVIDPPACFQDTQFDDDDFELLENMINDQFNNENIDDLLNNKKNKEELNQRKYSDDLSSIDSNLINDNDNLSIPDHFQLDNTSPNSEDTDTTVRNLEKTEQPKLKAEDLFSVDDKMYEEYKIYEETYLKEKDHLVTRKQKNKIKSYGIELEEQKNKISNDSAYGSLNRNNAKPTTVKLSPFQTKLSDKQKMSKFCHECGSKYPLMTAKFCVECGVKRLML